MSTGDNLFNDQPDEILALYMKNAKYPSELRLINLRFKQVYDDLAPQIYKVIKYSQYNPIILDPLPLKWKYWSILDRAMNIPSFVLKNSYGFKIVNIVSTDRFLKVLARSLLGGGIKNLSVLKFENGIMEASGIKILMQSIQKK